MIYLYEALFSFFFIFFTCNAHYTNLEISLMVFSILLLGYSVSKKNYYNLTLGFSFFITNYRPITEIILCLASQVFGAFLAILLLFATGDHTYKTTSQYSFVGVLLVEFFTSLAITLVYYCLFVDMRNGKENGAAFGIAALYGGVTLAFPTLSNGNFSKVLAIQYANLEVVFGSLLGQVIGSILAGIMYKFLICENNSLKMKEIDITNNDVNINF